MTTDQDIVARIRAMDTGALLASVRMMMAALAERLDGRPDQRATPALKAPRAVDRMTRREQSRVYHQGLGERLQRVRALLGKTEEEMAAVFGVTTVTYARYERGHQGHGSKQQVGLGNLADLGVSLDYLVAGTLPIFREGMAPSIVPTAPTGTNVISLAGKSRRVPIG